MHGLGYLPPPASVPTTSTQYAWGAYTTHGYSHRARQNSNVCDMHGLGCYSHQPELLTPTATVGQVWVSALAQAPGPAS